MLILAPVAPNIAPKSGRGRHKEKRLALGEPSMGGKGSGGAEGNRTLDPLLAKQVLSQLSYSPPFGPQFNPFTEVLSKKEAGRMSGLWS